jgi:outer membrane protein TolC
MTTRKAIAPSADGIDNVTVGMSFNVPLYRKRLDARVREAEAQAVASAREYDELRDETMRDVKSLFAQATSQQEISRLLRESIVPKNQQALEISMREYSVGTTSYVQMIDNWRELLRSQILQQQVDAQLRQTIASLARAVVSFELPRPPLEPPPPPAIPPQSIPEPRQ